ncbi:MAG: hypothetical protein JWN75_876 [Candidatus Saccharibacteria bacterium]|nr:hypothetical protein [Candidatus Saccharibacteria bacterium]
MNLRETTELLLNHDAEVDAATYLSSHVIDYTDGKSNLREPEHLITAGLNKDVASNLRDRIAKIVMGDPSFEKPHVLLSRIETELVVAAAHNYEFIEDEHPKPPAIYVQQEISKFAAVVNEVFGEPPLS